MSELVARSADLSAVAHASPRMSGSASSATFGRDDPRSEIRIGLIVAGIFFVLFLGWAAFARLDAAANAPGRLVVTGQRQTVQHRDGGVVGEILVKEGDRVRRGQVVMRLAAADVRAQERGLAAQAITLLAQRQRIKAEQTGSPLTAPAEFASLPEEDRAAAAEAMRIQQAQLRTRAAVLSAQRGAFGERGSQAGAQGTGYSRQIAAIDEQVRLLDEELNSLRTVAEKGFVSQNRLRALERSRAELIGQRGQYTATVAQSRSLGSESQLQSLEARSSYLERAATELREVEAALNDVLPKLNAARDQLSRTEIRSPATGTVVGLQVFTPGGVIAAGQKLMDVVPERTPLTVEARVSPGNADDLNPGQMAYVRFDTLHERNLRPLEGKVTRVSADSFTDERTGEDFFTATVDVPLSELEEIQAVRGQDFELRAGMPVSVQVPLRRRTALQYMMEPLTGAMRKSLHEQ
jgi:HlyD family secretion protein